MFFASKFRRDFYVTPSGSNAAKGDAAHPLATLAEAARRADSAGGATVYVGADALAPLPGSVLANATPLTLLPWNAPDFYVQALPGGQDALTLTGPGLVTMTRGRFDGTPGTLAGVSFGTTTPGTGQARLVATDCTALGTQSGWNGIGRFLTADFLRATGRGLSNDGFGFHGIPGDPTVSGHATMTSCAAADCGDEAISPHEYVVLDIIGGLFTGSQQSGMAAVGSAVCNISGGAIFENNGKDPANNYGGLYYSETTSGVLNGVILRNNDGPGLWKNTTGNLTLTDYTSTGNGAPDIL